MQCASGNTYKEPKRGTENQKEQPKAFAGFSF